MEKNTNLRIEMEKKYKIERKNTTKIDYIVINIISECFC